MSLIANTTSTPYTPPVGTSTTQTSGIPVNPDELQAGFWKRTGDSVGEFFSNIADGLHFGETYKLIKREFEQLDQNNNGVVSNGEFIVGTLTFNPFEFQNADRNMDNHLQLNEYVSYRKSKLSFAFAQKEVSGDGFLNTAEIGTVGKIYLANRDPNVDRNQDGLLSKREYMRAHLHLGISIRDILGF